MVQKTDIHTMLYRARLLLEEGRSEAALLVLKELDTQDEKQQQELAYLSGWANVQLKRWNDAVQILTPLLNQATRPGEPETTLDRERQALYLLRLGIAASNLAYYEDASQHFTLCLKVLHDRRIHLPSVRIQARYSLAMTCIERGLYITAVQQYEEAQRLCRHYNNEEELPHIFHGLCVAYRHVNDLEKADTAGQEALRLYAERGERGMEARMYNMLGLIRSLRGDYRSASDNYTESLALATSHNTATLIMVNCAALADLRLAEGRMEEARRYCRLALDIMERADKPHMRGATYHIIGKVAHQDALLASDDSQRLLLLEEAISWFSKARDELSQTQAYADIAAVDSSWAQALEEQGRMEEAIERWRTGYAALAFSYEPK